MGPVDKNQPFHRTSGMGKMSCGRASTAAGPALKREMVDSAELSGIVRDKRQSKAARMSGDEQIVGPNHRSLCLELRSNSGVVKRSVIGEVQDFDITKECAQGRLVLLSLRRNLNAIQQFRLGYDRYADVAHCHLL